MPAKALARPARRKPTPKAEFVLDASVAVAWFFEDEGDAYTEAVENSLERAVAVVPALWSLEVTNALLVGERRGRTTADKVTRFMHLLAALPVTVDDQTNARAFHDVLAIAREQNLSAYDAAYIELASRRGLPLATLDARLQAATTAVGVSVYMP
jgi:predicted nucleic acid-binding protein